MTAERANYIAGLRALASLLQEHEDLPLPSQGAYNFAPFTFVFGGDEGARDRLAAAVRAIGGEWQKRTTENTELGFAHLRMSGRIGSLYIETVADREAVCTRRVVAVREVTEEVPDPDVLATVPIVTVTKTVEDVEWDCGPILAPRESVSA